jgi:hypothetical protein
MNNLNRFYSSHTSDHSGSATFIQNGDRPASVTCVTGHDPYWDCRAQIEKFPRFASCDEPNMIVILKYFRKSSLTENYLGSVTVASPISCRPIRLALCRHAAYHISADLSAWNLSSVSLALFAR